MRAVNLLPADANLTTRRTTPADALPVRRVFEVAGAVAGVFVLLFGGLYLYERSVVHGKQAKLSQVQAQLSAVQTQVASIKQEQAEATARYSTISSVSSTRMNWSRTMVDLARVLPTDAYLTTLQATAPQVAAPVTSSTSSTTSSTSSSTTSSTTSGSSTSTTTAAPTTSTFQLSGVTPAHVRVAAVLDRLALLPWLSNVGLQSSTRQADGTVQFTITSTVSEVH